jgi:hypothetical protein
MLETIGTVMIAAAIVVLLILMALAYQPGGAERRPAVAETIIAGLAALLAIGLGLAEFGTSRAEGEAHGVIEVSRFGMVGGALVLMWLWVRLGPNRQGRVSP